MLNEVRQLTAFVDSIAALRHCFATGDNLAVRGVGNKVDSPCKIVTLNEHAGTGTLMNNSVYVEFNFVPDIDCVRIYTDVPLAEPPALRNDIILSGARFLTATLKDLHMFIERGLYAEFVSLTSNGYMMYLVPIAIIDGFMVVSQMDGSEQLRDYRARIMSANGHGTTVVFVAN